MKIIFSESGKTIIAILVALIMIGTFAMGGFFADLLSDYGNKNNNVSYSDSDKAFGDYVSDESTTSNT